MTYRERMANILGWTPEVLETMREIQSGCICHQEPMADMINRQLDELEKVAEEAYMDGFAEGRI